MTYNKKVDLSNYRTKTDVPFSFGIDSSGNYGYIKDGADTVIPFKSQSDIDNAYKTGYTKGKADGKIEYNSIFRAPTDTDKVGDSGTIADGTYNARWLIYTISDNTYQLFPMKNLGSHVMNSNDYNTGGYTASEMYTYVHNTVLPNLKRSGLNITACDLVSRSIWKDIYSKTGMLSATIVGYEVFWLADLITYGNTSFYAVHGDGSYDGGNEARTSLGVRPLITVIK